jgi:DNA polymerase I
MPTGAVMGFCKMLNAMVLDSMIAGLQPRVVLCFDAKGRTFRHDMYAEYKGNRPSAPVDLVPQFDFVRQAAKAYGVAQIEAHWYEADDVIATLATRAIQEGVDVNILSGDKDLMQLVTDFGVSPSIQMIDPMKKDRTTHAEVVEKWEVGPRQLGDVLALAGDTADNVPGVKVRFGLVVRILPLHLLTPLCFFCLLPGRRTKDCGKADQRIRIT